MRLTVTPSGVRRLVSDSGNVSALLLLDGPVAKIERNAAPTIAARDPGLDLLGYRPIRYLPSSSPADDPDAPSET